MYALAICGSPRKGGNTELPLKEVLTELKDAGWQTEFAKVAERQFAVVLHWLGKATVPNIESYPKG